MFYAFLSALFFGIGDVFTKVASVKLQGTKMTFYNAIVSFPIALILFFVFRGNFPDIRNVPILLFIQSMSALAFLFFFLALVNGPVSIVGSIVAGYSVITVLGGLFFLNERLSVFQYIAVFMIISGSVLITYHSERKKGSKLWILWTILATLLWGIWALFTKKYESLYDPRIMPVLFGLVAPIVWLPFLIYNKKDLKGVLQIDKKGLIFVLLSVFITTTGGILFYYAVQNGNISLITPIVGTYPVVTVILSFTFLKERFSFHQMVAFVIIMVGIIMINL